MSRNSISANPEHYIFKIFWGSMPSDPLEGLKKFFSMPRGSNIFLRINFPPKQKILDRTLVTAAAGRQGVWCEEKVFIIRNATPVVPIENCVQYQEGRICSTRRRFWQHQESVQHKKVTSVVEKQGRKKGNICSRKTGCVL